MRRPEQLLQDLQERLGGEGQAALAALAEAARAHGSDLYLVGGSVRDLLLGRGHVDLDFVVEVEAPAVARAYARIRQARVVVHDRFLTATVLGPDFSFDLVTARREVYPQPGALPVVTPARLADDLARRDFTVNTLALAVSGQRAGALIDPYDGLNDLHRRRLRVLHDGSFIDDPTRLWRAGRYMARFQLKMDAGARRAAEAGLPYLARVSSPRIGHELERTLAEPAPEEVLYQLDRFAVLEATLPDLRCSAATRRAAADARALVPDEAALACLATLFAFASASEIERATERLALSHRQGQTLRALPPLRATLRLLVAREASPGAIALELDRFPAPAVAALAARSLRGAGGRAARRYLMAGRHIRPLLTARAILGAGLPPGPLVGELIRALRAARIDGAAGSLDGERRLVDTMLEDRGMAALRWPATPNEGRP